MLVAVPARVPRPRQRLARRCPLYRLAGNLGRSLNTGVCTHFIYEIIHWAFLLEKCPPAAERKPREKNVQARREARHQVKPSHINSDRKVSIQPPLGRYFVSPKCQCSLGKHFDFACSSWSFSLSASTCWESQAVERERRPVPPGRPVSTQPLSAHRAHTLPREPHMQIQVTHQPTAKLAELRTFTYSLD